MAFFDEITKKKAREEVAGTAQVPMDMPEGSPRQMSQPQNPSFQEKVLQRQMEKRNGTYQEPNLTEGDSELPNFGKSQPVPGPSLSKTTQPVNDDAFLSSEPFRGTTLGNERRLNAATYSDSARIVGGNSQEAVAAIPGDPRGKVSNDTTPLAAGLQRDGIQSQRIDQATGESFLRAMAPPVSTFGKAMEQNAKEPPTTTEYGQGPNGTFTTRQVPIVQRDPRRQLGLPESRYNVGNMEVTFDPSVGQDARQRFLTDPVRPTAQINRFNANSDEDQGMLAAQNAGRVLGIGRVKGPPEAITSNGPNKTWDDAADTDRKVIENSAARRDFFNKIENDQKDRNLTNQETQTGIAGRRLGVEAQNYTERNAIDRAAQELSAQNKAAELEANKPVREAQTNLLRTQAEDLPARRAVDERRLGVEDKKLAAQGEKNRIEEERNLLTAANKIEDPIERANFDLANYDPKGPPSAMQARGKAAVKTMGSTIAEEHKASSGMFKDDPLPTIAEKYFPQNVSPDIAKEIIENIPDKNLRKKLAGYLYDRHAGR